MTEEYPRIGEIPFTSERKCMSTIHQTPEKEKIAYVKGAPEIVLEKSSQVFENGKEWESCRLKTMGDYFHFKNN
jgi:Ca2+-transporting ATPase